MRTKMKWIIGLTTLLAPPLIGIDDQAQAGEANDGAVVVTAEPRAGALVATDNHWGGGWGRGWGFGRGWGSFGGGCGYGYDYGYGYGDGCIGGGWNWYY